MGYVVGTAGHIDHGKSTLIRALTGIDPDRLEEEKRRGMTIDLGFGHMTLRSGRTIGLVDVPGHARFIRNMLAGVHGLDAVLLVVAADEGVMPQTVEHLQIVDLLEISAGIVALTKVDLVDSDWLALVTADLKTTLADTSLAAAPIMPVSAVTGAGLRELAERLDAILDGVPVRSATGRPRLPIDRAFSMRGFGTVVTGTLVDGALRVGEEVVLIPGERPVRIRGLQQHGRSVESAEPGSRVAANLVGIEKDQVRRGQVLARPGSVASTRRADARIRVLSAAPAPLRHGAAVMVHTGTAEVMARATMLDDDAIHPGKSGWVQFYFQAPVAAVAGDRLVVRLPSRSLTVGGGRLVDVTARRHARLDHRVTASLENRLSGGFLQEELAKHQRGIALVELLNAVGGREVDLRALEAKQAGGWIFPLEGWRALGERMTALLASYHETYPLRPGMPREELNSRLKLSPGAFQVVSESFRADGVIVVRQSDIALPSHSFALRPEDAHTGMALVEVLGANRFSPPSLPEAMRQTGASPDVLQALLRSGEIVRLAPDYAFTGAAYTDAVAAVRRLAAENGSVSLAHVKEVLGTSRRPVLALLEHLDATRVTRRVGDLRVLR